MANMPKRRKLKDNPYSLDIDEDNKYKINFKDNKNVIHSIEVSEKVFNAFSNFELEDIRIMHEYERHIEHLDLDENNIHQKTAISDTSLEDIVEEKILNEDIRNAINELSDIQKKRVIKYYFEGKNEYEIAIEEGTTQQAVNKSLKAAKDKLKDILKNIYF